MLKVFIFTSAVAAIGLTASLDIVDKTVLSSVNKKATLPDRIVTINNKNERRYLAKLGAESCEACEIYAHSEGCHGSCHSCGFSDDVSDIDNANDCLSCPSGYEVDVYYSDCTGYCVPIGTAVNPVGESNCELYCHRCGFPYHPFNEYDSCSADMLNDCASHSFTPSGGCFPGDTSYGACVSCGYDDTVGNINTPADCISCERGYEIDVVYPDCTGRCVPEGSAVVPIEKSTCKMPCTSCGKNYDGFVSTGNVVIESDHPFQANTEQSWKVDLDQFNDCAILTMDPQSEITSMADGWVKFKFVEGKDKKKKIKLYGESLAEAISEPLQVEGKKIKIKFKSFDTPAVGNDYGFKVTISPCVPDSV